ncbi:cellulose binding domain-containing protein [Micromonospora zamorensis]|uniref:cellulose binding domain-containing protein n=1 Tax=Micromonospora zamorensis TaxID=709883 RepID=UPI0033C60499
MKYTANSWGNGFTADVQVTNTGSSAINGWTLNYGLPNGKTVTNAWNATANQSRSAMTARNVGHNGPTAPGGTTHRPLQSEGRCDLQFDRTTPRQFR